MPGLSNFSSLIGSWSSSSAFCATSYYAYSTAPYHYLFFRRPVRLNIIHPSQPTTLLSFIRRPIHSSVITSLPYHTSCVALILDLIPREVPTSGITTRYSQSNKATLTAPTATRLKTYCQAWDLLLAWPLMHNPYFSSPTPSALPPRSCFTTPSSLEDGLRNYPYDRSKGPWVEVCLLLSLILRVADQ